MSEATDRVRHNYHRMKILRALLAHVGIGVWLEFDELSDVLDLMSSPIASDNLAFHLRYCNEMGWLDLQIGRTAGKVDAILAAKLTAAGVDQIDIGKMPDLEDTQKFPRRERS